MKYLENSRIISWTLGVGSNARQYVAEEDSLKHMELHCQIEDCKNKAPDNGSYQESFNPSYFPLDLEKGETLTLKYRVVVHGGGTEETGIAKIYEDYE